MIVEAPARVIHRYRQRLRGTSAEVFPLLCPVREAEWVAGWEPSIVYTFSGFVEEECVFVTPGDEREAVWVVTEHDPDARRVGFVKVTPGVVVVRIHITLHDDGEGCAADVQYSYTALSPAGKAVVARMTREAYEAFMRGWEDELNAFLDARPSVA